MSSAVLSYYGQIHQVLEKRVVSSSKFDELASLLKRASRVMRG